ncbi:MAG: S9 family peptidase [Candidatus Marinimicrobia bacterium]|nr:S9 family peptidase [Candidatus Neomarinimicrobiota bacterium]MDD5582978.1 S9 family peptidase [Candidatus Neomarinimicrobiota bacterium]
MNKKEKNVQPDDLYRLNFPSDPQISPDGEKVVFVKTWIDKKDQKYYANLYSVDTEKKSLHQITRGHSQDRHPRWNKNGKQLIFIRNTTETCDLLSFYEAPAEPMPLLSLDDGDIKDIDFSPDGMWIGLLIQKLDTSKRDQKKEPLKREIHRLFYRLDGEGFRQKKAVQLYIMKSRGGKLIQVTDVPQDVTDFSWNYDSSGIYYVTNDHEDADKHMDEESIFFYSMDEKKHLRVEKPAGPVGWIQTDSSENYLYFSGHFKPGESWGAVNFEIQKLDLKTGEITSLTKNIDRTTDMVTLGDITPSFVKQKALFQTPESFLFTVSSEGANPLLQYNLNTDEITPLIDGPECVIAFSLSENGKRVAIHLAQMERPDELWLLTMNEEKHFQRITFLNDNYMDSIACNLPEVYSIPSEQIILQGWLLMPPDFKKTKKYPLLLQIHGGPRTQYGYTWFHEMHVFAAAGYVVLYTNPRGSQGYGHTFADAITGKWAEPTMQDLMTAVDYVLKLGFIDSEKCFVTGGSFGGYMTNWIVGHTNRFKAAVTQRSICDLASFFGTSDTGWDLKADFHALPWKNSDVYAKWSPITYANDINTPLCIIHSENDLRCPVEQAEQLFVRLKYDNKPVKYVLFPEESHGLSRSGRPDRRVERLKVMLSYFNEEMNK